MNGETCWISTASPSITGRIKNSPTITPETLKEMEAGLTAATDVILPGVPLDVVAYGCTSGAMVIGEDRVAERIRAARPDVAVTTPITGALAALKALGAKRIALLTSLYRSHQPDDARLYRGARLSASR
jgi:maleate isomerase